MTDKRFEAIGKDILQGGDWWCSAGGKHCADVIATALNILNDENIALKSSNMEYDGILGRLEEENKGQQQKLSDIRGQLVMFDNCDNWSNDRKMSFIREVAEIMNYHGGF